MSACKMAFIMPTKYVMATMKLYSNYHLLLAQEFLNLEETQRNAALTFWRTCIKNGHHVILDNGAYELGVAIDYDAYMQIAVELKPTEIVLPDILQDGEGSMRKTAAFLREYKKPLRRLGIQSMAVVQANSSCDIDMAFIADQLDYYMSEDVASIGIPKHFGDNRAFGRVEFAARLGMLHGSRGLYRNQFEWHFLGLSCIPEVQELPKFSWVRGLDSAVPFVYAFHGLKMQDHANQFIGKAAKRPNNFFDLSSLRGRVSLLNSNVAFCRDSFYWARSTTWQRYEPQCTNTVIDEQ